MLTATISHIYKKYVQFVDPDGSWLILATKSTCTGFIAMALLKIFALPQSLFLILPAVLYMLANVGNYKHQRIIAMALTGICSTIGVFVTTIIGQQLGWLIPWLAICSFLAIYIGTFGIQYLMSGVLALIVSLIATSVSADFDTALLRSCNCLLGLIIALTMTFIILPHDPYKQLRRNLAIVMREMANLFEHVIMDSLRGNHLQLHHHVLRLKIMQCMQKNYDLLQELSGQQKVILANIYEAEEQLLEALLAVLNILGIPANKNAFVQLLANFHDFSACTGKLMHDCALALNSDESIVDAENFIQTVTELERTMKANLATTMQNRVIYQWPFDIANFLYVVVIFKTYLIAFSNLLSHYHYENKPVKQY